MEIDWIKFFFGILLILTIYFAYKCYKLINIVNDLNIKLATNKNFKTGVKQNLLCNDKSLNSCIALQTNGVCEIKKDTSLNLRPFKRVIPTSNVKIPIIGLKHNQDSNESGEIIDEESESESDSESESNTLSSYDNESYKTESHYNKNNVIENFNNDTVPLNINTLINQVFEDIKFKSNTNFTEHQKENKLTIISELSEELADNVLLDKDINTELPSVPQETVSVPQETVSVPQETVIDSVSKPIIKEENIIDYEIKNINDLKDIAKDLHIKLTIGGKAKNKQTLIKEIIDLKKK
jgi:hypothetical protein